MKQAWDRFLLIGLALLVIGIAAFFIIKSLGFSNQFDERAGTSRSKGSPPKEDKSKEAEYLADLKNEQGVTDGTLALVQSPRTWELPLRGEPIKPVPLFVSIPIIELDSKAGDPRDPTFGQMRPPVSNEWLVDNDLDFTKRSVLSFDPDKDGFSNLEEWHGKTDPQNARSHPYYIKKVDFIKRVGKAYSITFQGVPSADEYQIRRDKTAEWSQKVFFVKVGQVSKDNQFRIESFTKAEQKEKGIIVDRSVLTITYLPTGEKINLTKRIRKEIFKYFAELDYTLDSAVNMEIEAGQTFRLPKDLITYTLDAVTEESATVSFKDKGKPQTVEISKKR